MEKVGEAITDVHKLNEYLSLKQYKALGLHLLRIKPHKPLQYLCQENSRDWNKRLKDMRLEDEPLRSEGIQHATEEEQRTSTSSSRANEIVGPKLKGCSAADVLEMKGKSDAAKKNTA